MSTFPDIASRTIIHFNCPLCGSTPAEQRMEDFLAAWDCQDLKRLQSLMTHVYTALRQLRDGEKKWRSMEFLRCVAFLLERIRNGREETEFPLL